MFRARATGFLVGFGVASGFALYQIRQDILKSNQIVSNQADHYRTGLEKRVAALEATVESLAEKAVAHASAPAPDAHAVVQEAEE